MIRYWTLQLGPVKLYSDGQDGLVLEYSVNLDISMVDSKVSANLDLLDLDGVRAMLFSLLQRRLKRQDASNLARLAVLRAYRHISKRYPYLLSIKATVASNPEYGRESAIIELNVEDMVLEEENNGAA